MAFGWLADEGTNLAIDFGSDIFGGFFGNDPCEPRDVQNDIRAAQLAQAIRSDPSVRDRLQSSMNSLFGDHHCMDQIQSAGTDLFAMYVIYAGTGFTDRDQTSEDAQLLSEAEREIQRWQSNQSQGPTAGTPSTTVSPSPMSLAFWTPERMTFAAGALVLVLLAVLLWQNR